MISKRRKPAHKVKPDNKKNPDTVNKKIPKEDEEEFSIGYNDISIIVNKHWSQEEKDAKAKERRIFWMKKDNRL